MNKLVAIVATLGLAATGCGVAWVSSPTADQVFACGFQAHPTNGETFATVSTLTWPTGVEHLEWDRLLRQRNHFVGAADTKLDAGQMLVIPRTCGKTEKKGHVTPAS